MARIQKSICRVVIDESISPDRWQRVLRSRVSEKLRDLPTTFVAERHRGFPDEDILTHVLTEDALLITTDSVLHNTALSLGFTSAYARGDSLRLKKIQGIPTKAISPRRKRTEPPPRAAPTEEQVQFRSLVLPASEKKRKKLRTQQRRIRSLFQGEVNLRELSLTVATEPTSSGFLTGAVLRVASDTRKAVDVAARYVRETGDPETHSPIGVCYALLLVARLGLERLPATVYLDGTRIDRAEFESQLDKLDPKRRLLHDRIAERLPELELVFPLKSARLQRLYDKLRALRKHDYGDEIVRGDLTAILERLE